MRFLADLHIHSHHSRATSRDLKVPTLLAWAQRKGLGLVGTGDFTHPAWFAELKESLEEDGRGLLVPRPDVARAVAEGLPEGLRREVRFLLQVEVSSIFRKAGRVRKVHTLVFAPSLAAAERFSTALGRLGNIRSDGRPIVGLEPLRILDLARDADPDAFVVPAHVWTPHFSLFGSQSGFDAIEECFEDRSSEVFALETGLSSDIPMNRRWSALDRFTLISCSDAHSPSRLGREATIFDGDLSYQGVLRALRGQGGLLGTIEFFPEEGKYHLDGHRKCGVRASPAETRAFGGRCPVCGGPLTPGVLGRVEALADRAQPAAGFPPQTCLIPLEEVLAEIEGVGPSSRRVQDLYRRVVTRFGPELEVLGFADLAPLREAAPLLAEALARMRAGRVSLQAGYDGEYGRVGLFDPGEVESLRGQGMLLPVERRWTVVETPRPVPDRPPGAFEEPRQADLFAGVAPGGVLTDEQEAAVTWEGGPVLVVAGPGTGKTRTLVARAERLLGRETGGVLVLTFTNRAADEVRSRLGDPGGRARVTTFHALALAEWNRWRAARGLAPLVVVDRDAAGPPAGVAAGDWCDLDGLVRGLVRVLRDDPEAARALRVRYPHVLVDEFQDISPDQFALLRLLCPDGSRPFAVGDPDQTIYAFRGSDPRAFERFATQWPGTRAFALTRTHRLGPEVCRVAVRLAPGRGSGRVLQAVRSGASRVRLVTARSAADEAAFVSREVRRLVGGLDMTTETHDSDRLAFGQIAVLGRTHQVVGAVARTLGSDGIPVERASDRPLWDTPWVRVVMDALHAAPAGADPREVAARVVRDARLRPPPREWTAFLGLLEDQDPASALARLATLREVDAWGLDPERVACLTIHAAKGLEFDAVFVVGCEDGVLPRVVRGRESDLDEERRLLFVAVTRARRWLTLSYPTSGGGGSGRPSRFLEALAPGDAEHLAPAALPPRFRQQTLFGEED